MNRILAIVAVVFVVASTAFAQSNNPPTNTGTITPSQAADIVVAGIEGDASNWVMAVDGLYAPHADQSSGKFGAVLMLGYKPGSNQYLIVGLHVEYLNDLPTYGGGQVTLQLPVHPLAGFVGRLPKFLTDRTATPWAFVGSGTSFGNGKAVTVVGEAAAGLELNLITSPHGFYQFGVNGGIGKRTDLSGQVFIGGIDNQFNF